jgi:hypothetical protein
MTKLTICSRVGLGSGALVAVLLAAGCFQGRPSKEPPIHLNPNMDSQPKVTAQSGNAFFADGASMRPLPAGTVARGWLKADATEPVTLSYDDQTVSGEQLYAYHTGKGSREKPDEFVEKLPINITMRVLQRGQERYNVYCALCHGETGDGLGIVTQRGAGRSMIVPPGYTTDRLMTMPDGQLFNVITNGGSVMPAYRNQVPVEDRWAIVAYMRALQRSQHAPREKVPAELLRKLETTGQDQGMR